MSQAEAKPIMEFRPKKDGSHDNGTIAAHREVPSLDIEQTIVTSVSALEVMLNGSVKWYYSSS